MLYIYMYSLSALYMLRSVPIVKVILVILFKKKKKKKRENDPYLGMGKNTKVMPRKSPLSIFSLGKGGNPSSLTLFKTRNLVRFLHCPPARQIFFQIQALCKRCMPKFQKLTKIHFSAKFHTFPVTEGYTI